MCQEIMKYVVYRWWFWNNQVAVSAGGNWTSIRGCWSGTKPYQSRSRSQQPHQLYRSQSHTEANHNGDGQLGSTFKYQFWSLQLHYGYSLVNPLSSAMPLRQTERLWSPVVAGVLNSFDEEGTEEQARLLSYELNLQSVGGGGKLRRNFKWLF